MRSALTSPPANRPPQLPLRLAGDHTTPGKSAAAYPQTTSPPAPLSAKSHSLLPSDHHRTVQTRRSARPAQPAPVAVQDPEGLIEDSLSLLASIYNPSMAARASRSTSPATSSALPTPPSSPTPPPTVPQIAPHVMHWFIVELLRRSHTSAPVIRAAIEYVSRAAPEIQRAIESESDSPLLDPRRVFLAAIILGSKFLLDRTYTNKTWAGVSGLDALEVGRCERALAEALQWRLWIGGPNSFDN